MTEQKTSPRQAAKGLLPLWLFLCLSAASSWTVWLWPTQQRSVYLFLLGWRVDWPFANLKLVIGNCLPGILALIFSLIQGKQQLGEMLSSLVAWRAQLRWYILSIALPCGVFVASLGVVLILFLTKISRPSITVLLTSLLTLPFGPVWEEIAWRAFALRKLQRRYSRPVSALVLGVYWAVWHIPLWLMTLHYLTTTLLLIMCLNLISWSVIFAFLYDRSAQSLPVVILLHATYVAVQNQVFATVSYGNIQLIPVSAALSVCLAAALARRWR
jgi:membrane protease YdiL (CAAX protease family)